MKTDLQTALDAEGVFPGAVPATPVFRWKPRVGNTASQPANDPVNPGTMYFNTDLQAWQMDNGTAWVTLANPTPAGFCQWGFQTSPPAGWLLCNGQAVSRTTYANLFAAIGISCGSGDGLTTFNLPDVRGKFMRMVDGGAGNDPDTTTRTAMNSGGNTGDAVGSIQGQKTAVNGLHDTGHSHVQRTQYVAGAVNGNFGWADLTNVAPEPSGNTDSASAALAGDSETRPLNVYANLFIKF